MHCSGHNRESDLVRIVNYRVIPFQGLGDELYQRPFVKGLVKKGTVYIQTPWPEIYEDIDNVFFLKPNTPLRTQRKNEDRQSKDRWYTRAPVPCTTIRGGYKRGSNIPEELKNRYGVDPGEPDLPSSVSSDPIIDGDYILLRPVSVRTERAENTRNPDHKYINEVAQYLIDQGYKVVSVADIDGTNEVYVGDPPPATLTYDRGEFAPLELLNVVKHAKGCVGPIGWIVPAAIMANVPAWIVCGGQGHMNHPDKLISPMFPHEITFAIPDNMCMCSEFNHVCDKTITNHLQRFTSWLEGINIKRI